MASSTIIPLSRLKPGIVLTAPIYDGANPQLLLLGNGTRLTEATLRRIEERGITSVAIDKSLARILNVDGAKPAARKAAEKSKKDLPPCERRLIDRITKTRTEEYNRSALESIRKASKAHTEQLSFFYASLGANEKVDGKSVRDVTAQTIENMVQDLDLFVKLSLEQGEGDQIHQHCMRVAQLAMSIAAVLECTEDEIQQIGMGCLISRSGLSSDTRALIDEDRLLTIIERLELQKIPARTFSRMEEVPDIPVGARQVAYQINERFNGSGYPRGRIGVQIHKLARIASVADVFVALTSPRPHRSAFLPYRAVEQVLVDTKSGLFDPDAVRGLLRTVSLFPIGSIVLLNDNRYARVIRTNQSLYDRPVVEVLSDHFGAPVVPKIVDLAEDELVRISDAVDPDDIPDTTILDLHSEGNAQKKSGQRLFDWDEARQRESAEEDSGASSAGDQPQQKMFAF